jgi:hypothetical protein
VNKTGTLKKNWFSQAWWYMTIIPTLRKLRQEDYKFEATLCYVNEALSHFLKEREEFKKSA